MAANLFFAWVDEGVAFDAPTHAVQDEDIISLTISQEEGDFASLEIEVSNPGEGLLAPGRKQWCWVSWDTGSGIDALFNGRLIAAPKQFEGETVTLEFIAKPVDYETVKADLADSLKVLPYWDKVWIAGDLSDDDTVLSAYGARWHIDRVSLDVTISDELESEDGTIILTADDIIYANVGETYAQKPKLKGKFKGTLTFSQTGKGTIDMTNRIQTLFIADKSIYRNPGSGVISTLTGDGLKSDWPQGGTSLGGGWTVNNDTDIQEADTANFAPYTYDVTYQGLSPSWDSSTETTSFAWLDSLTDYKVSFPVAALKQVLKFDWAADRKRTEILEIEMLADIQPLESDTSDTESTVTLTISAADTVTEPDEYSGEMPIVDKKRKAYLPTTRGADSIAYPLLLLRAELRRGARAIEHKLRTPWAQGVGATLRKSIYFPSARIPAGGTAGKITSYKFVSSAQDGRYCEFVIGAAIGYGGTVSATGGTGTYAEDGYMETGYQQMSGAQVAVAGFETELVYDSIDGVVIDDDGIDLQTMDEFTSVTSLELTGGLATQITAVSAAYDPITALKDYPSVVCLQLKPVADMDGFETTFTLTVDPLPIPLGVNLESPV